MTKQVRTDYCLNEDTLDEFVDSDSASAVITGLIHAMARHPDTDWMIANVKIDVMPGAGRVFSVVVTEAPTVSNVDLSKL